MYAIVKTGGKQYRVEEGQALLVERLPADSGAEVSLQPLLYVDGQSVVDGAELGKVKVQARVLAHERGPKLRIVKFKPKRGYRRRTGHRQELTRLEVTALKLEGADHEAAVETGAPARKATPGAGAVATATPPVPEPEVEATALPGPEVETTALPGPEVNDGA